LKYPFLITTILSIFLQTSQAAVVLNSLVGRYGHYDIVAYTGKFTGPIKMRSLVISYGITEFYLQNNELWTKDRFCFSEYKSNIPFKTSVSDEFTQAIIPEPTRVEVREADGQIQIFRPETPTLLGVKLDSYLDPFPEDPNDPAYIDADRDGKPGVTVKLSLGKVFNEELYIARKELFSYRANVKSDGRIIGTVIDRSEQHIIAASKQSLVKENNPRQDQDLRKSPLILVPIHGDVDCLQLKEMRKDLFPKNPKPYFSLTQTNPRNSLSLKPVARSAG
jgi:hypothetical protein